MPSALFDPNDPGLPAPLIDTGRLISGGPGPEGIPAVDRPRFLAPHEIDWLTDKAGQREQPDPERLRNLAGHQNLLLQTSLDGACAATHDLHRGRGSWARTVDGIRRAVAMGIPVRVALTQTAENEAEIPAVLELLAGLGVPAEAFAVRPMLRRGLSVLGVDIGPGSTVPELTVTAEGLHWHPAGADLGTSPDMLLAAGEVPLAIGKRFATERFFAARLADGSLPQPYRCAI